MKPVTQLKTPYNQNLSENMLNRQLTQLTQLTPTPSLMSGLGESRGQFGR
jgi:hypothetical protein